MSSAHRSGWRKLALTAHVTVCVGWVGAVAVFLAHAAASLFSQEQQVVRAASIAMALSAWFVIMPLSLASLATGLVQALTSAWGLFRHYWVLFKLILTVAATTVLLLKLAPIRYLADVAAQPVFSVADETGLRTSLMVHAVGGLLVLLAVVVLAIYKPAGMTRCHGIPAWVKNSAIAVVGLILLVCIMFLFGNHGPNAHVSVR